MITWWERMSSKQRWQNSFKSLQNYIYFTNNSIHCKIIFNLIKFKALLFIYVYLRLFSNLHSNLRKPLNI